MKTSLTLLALSASALAQTSSNLPPLVPPPSLRVASVAPASAPSTVAPAAPAIRTSEDLKNYLANTKWTFEALFNRGTVVFQPDGLVVNKEIRWLAKWTAVSPTVVEMKMEGHNLRHARITFSPDYTSYSGVHFGGKDPIKGTIMPPKPK